MRGGAQDPLAAIPFAGLLDALDQTGPLQDAQVVVEFLSRDRQPARQRRRGVRDLQFAKQARASFAQHRRSVARVNDDRNGVSLFHVGDHKPTTFVVRNGLPVG